MQGRCHQTISLPARCAKIRKKILVHKLVDHKLVYHLHFLGIGEKFKTLSARVIRNVKRDEDVSNGTSSSLEVGIHILIIPMYGDIIKVVNNQSILFFCLYNTNIKMIV